MRSSSYHVQSEALASGLSVVYGGLIIASPFAVTLVKLDAASVAEIFGTLAPVVLWLQERSWIAVVLPIGAGATKWISERLKRRWSRQAVHSLLDKYADQVFDAFDGDSHHHRVTLYKYAHWQWSWRHLGKGCWPGSGWLIPFERSGHTTQNFRTRFWAPDDADRAEGVAGRVWARDREICLNKLPALTLESPDEQIRSYAADAFMSEASVRERLKQGASLATSFRGLPVEVKGKKWGVLVLDSRNSNAFSPLRGKEKVHSEFFLYALSKMLEGDHS